MKAIYIRALASSDPHSRKDEPSYQNSSQIEYVRGPNLWKTAPPTRTETCQRDQLTPSDDCKLTRDSRIKQIETCPKPPCDMGPSVWDLTRQLTILSQFLRNCIWSMIAELPRPTAYRKAQADLCSRIILGAHNRWVKLLSLWLKSTALSTTQVSLSYTASVLTSPKLTQKTELISYLYEFERK